MLQGAIVGAVGGLINRGVSIFENYQQSKIDAQKRAQEIEIAKIRASADTQIASYKHDTDGGQASQWVIDFLRLVRPIITFYALMLLSVFWFYAAEDDKALLVAGVLDLATMAVSWWFASRYKK